MKNESVSPEERLFKIIQQEKQSLSAQETEAREAGSSGWLKKTKEKALLWKEKLASLAQASIETARAGFSGKSREINLAAINKALLAFLILLVISALYYAVAQYPNTARIITTTVKAQGHLPAAGAGYEQFKSAGYYAEDAERRDIFIASHGAASGAETVIPEPARSSPGDLKLQGIAWSDVPKALIHSEKDNKMYVLKEAQAVGPGGMKVKKILKNKVILTDGEKDFEL